MTDFDNIPQELKDRQQWVCFNSLSSDSKKPLDASSPGTGRLRAASSTDPATWTFFDQSESCVTQERASGVGFVFSPEDTYAGIDLDGCVVNGQVSPWAMNIIHLLDSYTEFSPSGNGIHIVIKGAEPFRRISWACADTLKGVPGYRAIEIDFDKRYYRFTGHVLPAPYPSIQDRGPRLKALSIKDADKTPLIALAANGFTANRNDAFTSMGGLLRTHGLSEEHLTACLHLINSVCNVPPAPEEEIENIARSVCKYPPGKATKTVGGLLLPVVNAKGGTVACLANAEVLIPHIEGYGDLHYNEFDRKMYNGDEILADTHALGLHTALERFTTMSWYSRTVFDGMVKVAHQTKKHPLKAWLSALKWDRTERLNTWLPRYVGDPGNAMVGKTGRKFLLAAIDRVMRPGCYMPHVLLLMGPQNTGKSRLGSILAGSYFSDGLSDDLTNKDSIIAVRGKWIIEMPEMSCMRKTDIERAKFFISRQIDEIRDPYARLPIAWPRQCVFIGTTNESHPLRDRTGNRRFWPVLCPPTCDQPGLIAERDQLWAEALEAYNGGEKWNTPDREWEENMMGTQEKAVEEDEWEGLIQDFVERTKPDKFTMLDILTGPVALEIQHLTMGNQQRAGTCVTSLVRRGVLPYTKKRVIVGASLKNAYVRNEDAGPGSPLPKQHADDDILAGG